MKDKGKAASQNPPSLKNSKRASFPRNGADYLFYVYFSLSDDITI